MDDVVNAPATPPTDLNPRWFYDFCEEAFDLIQCVATDGRLLYTNQAWRNTLGYSVQEVPNVLIWDVISPECRAHCMTAFQQVMAGTPLAHFEVVFRTKSGRDVDLEGCATLCAEPGFPVHTRGIFRDITARKQAELARERLIAELQQALQEIKTLRGLIPICAWCKKVRDDQDFWHSVEDYVSAHTGARFSHGMCPACFGKAVSELKQRGSPE